MTIRVAIVEDDEGLATSLKWLLNGTDGFECVGTWSSGEAALAEIGNVMPDVVLMDLNLPGMDGAACARRIKGMLPSTQIMVLTMFEDDEKVFNSLESGASGYLLKRTSPARILEAIRELREGGSPMSPHIARLVVQRFQSPPSSAELASLTPREQQILALLSKGFLYKEIGAQLGIGFETVRTHLRSIYDKLHVHSRTEAVVKYLGH